MSQLPPFIERFKEASPEFGGAIEQLMGVAFAPGALEVKHKLLIAMVLDIDAGIIDGVETVASLARQAGASDAEIVDAIAMAATVKSIQTLHNGVHALSSAG